ncbi:hypothetical protein J15TS10_03370 [Paenibacillus woosongensis]|uniref:Uncharacterized protein n=1 Tax=Paenibacillus woosongensis TaxID=307580 RepID=A0ABQ4MKK2_9BACL|nr:hypothetical protein J15TS10_03370 [Paenibacillus woosongensis]
MKPIIQLAAYDSPNQTTNAMSPRMRLVENKLLLDATANVIRNPKSPNNM